MADLDSDLSQRLSRLAAAVPTGRLDPVHVGAVEARHRVRMAWMTPLAALVVIVVVGSLVGSGDTPGATSEPGGTAGSLIAADSDGDFTLTLRSAKAVYRPNEPIDMTASLTFGGPAAGAQIAHGLGANGGPLGFGILEPVAVPGVGLIQLGGGYRLACVESTLRRDAPITSPYAKGGTPVQDPPDGPTFEELQAYMADRVLRLPAGTWHVYAIARFSTGGCAGQKYELRAELTIEVAPGAPLPTQVAAGEGPTSLDRDGAFSLELHASKARYAPNEAIDVAGTLLFDGPNESIEFRHDSSGPIMFGIRERVFGEIDVGWISILMWDRTILQRSVPYARPFAKGGGLMGDHPDEAIHRAWLEDPVLRLPEGTWHLYAVAGGELLDGDSITGGFSLTAEIEIVVDDDPAATPGHPPATEYPYKPVYGGADIGGIALQLKSERPTYEVGAPIELSVWYWFMDGPQVIASHFQPEVGLSLVQLDATDPLSIGIATDSACTDLGVMTGQERHVEIGPRLITELRADALPQKIDDLFVDGELRLPVGRWRISASVIGEFGPCSGGGEPYEISTSLEIEVVERLE